jgi:hypothetical protein
MSKMTHFNVSYWHFVWTIRIFQSFIFSSVGRYDVKIELYNRQLYFSVSYGRFYDKSVINLSHIQKTKKLKWLHLL